MKKKILIVEDNNDSREVMKLSVTNMGYRAIQAKNGKEAIALAEAEAPDLIFMDMDLSDVDGVKITAILKQNPKTSEIPVVGVTAWEVGTLARESFESRYCNLFTKPGLTTVAHPKRNAILELAFCFALFLGFAMVMQGQAEEYYIYEDPYGELVISNKQPPPGSKIIKQQNFPEVTESEAPQAQQRDGHTEGSPKPSKNK